MQTPWNYPDKRSAVASLLKKKEARNAYHGKRMTFWHGSAPVRLRMAIPGTSLAPGRPISQARAIIDDSDKNF